MNTHEVNFEKWCKKCKHADESEWDEKSPCYECLNQGYNIDSTKPVLWEEK